MLKKYKAFYFWKNIKSLNHLNFIKCHFRQKGSKIISLIVLYNFKYGKIICIFMKEGAYLE